MCPEESRILTDDVHDVRGDHRLKLRSYIFAFNSESIFDPNFSLKYRTLLSFPLFCSQSPSRSLEIKS